MAFTQEKLESNAETYGNEWSDYERSWKSKTKLIHSNGCVCTNSETFKPTSKPVQTESQSEPDSRFFPKILKPIPWFGTV